MRRLSDTLTRLAQAQMGAQRPAAPDTGRLRALTGFGSNPGVLDAKIHVPTDLKPGAALVVALHGCTQNADGYDGGTGWSTLADRAGFALLLPEQRRANNMNLCFNWFEPADMARVGGEAESIAQMVEAMVRTHGLDRSRIYVTGLSAGGAMTTVMLATYPDLFAGGAIIAGLPYACATTVPQALDRMRGHGGVDDTAAGAAVRRASGGLGQVLLPTVSIWHGTTDATVVVSNMDRIAGQWRAVHGLPAEPSRTERGVRWERQVWQDADGRDAVETWRVAGMGHGVPLDPSGPSRLGRAGPYMLDMGLSSTHAIAASWGLASGEARTVSNEAPPPPREAAPASPHLAVAGVQGVLENALRSAGLMR